MRRNMETTDSKLLGVIGYNFEATQAEKVDHTLKSHEIGGEKPKWGLANEDVPAELSDWIMTPQKLQAFMSRKKDQNGGDSDSDAGF